MDLNFQFVFIYVATYIFVALFCVVILVRTSTDIARQLEIRYFKLLVGALLLYCIIESIWAIGNFGYSDLINRFNIPLSIVNSILVNSFCYLWFCYMESYLRSQIVNRRGLLFAASIPFVIVVALTISSLWTGTIFYQLPDGSAGRGPWYIWVIILSYAYAAVATIRAIVAALRSSESQQRAELITMSLFVIPPAVVGVIDTLVPMMPIVAPAFFFSFLIVFTMLQESQISTDSLTGLNNRRRAEKHFDEVRNAATKRHPYLIFMADANAFKAINDTHGHLEGDRALCLIAQALCDACRNINGFIARWGGDEFIVMVREDEVGTPEDFINMVEDCLLYEGHINKVPYKLSVSLGYARCTGPEQSKRQLLNEADEGLYVAKRQR